MLIRYRKQKIACTFQQAGIFKRSYQIENFTKYHFWNVIPATTIFTRLTNEIYNFVRAHLFSTDAKFCKKINISYLLIDTRALVFQKNLRAYWMDDPHFIITFFTSLELKFVWRAYIFNWHIRNIKYIEE